MERVFLTRSSRCVELTAEYLFDHYGRGGDVRPESPVRVDLSHVVVTTASSLASRTLLIELVRRAGEKGIELDLPKIVSVGQFPELLYRRTRPLADKLCQYLAWSQAARQITSPKLASILPNVPAANDFQRNFAFGKMLAQIHTELAADTLSFQGVHIFLKNLIQQIKNHQAPSEFADITADSLVSESQRWELLARVQENYHGILDQLGFWDRQSARLYALQNHQESNGAQTGDFQIDFDIILMGVVDLNRVHKRMLDKVSNRVTALIYAPEEEAAGFDNYGCLDNGYWSENLLCPLDRSQILQTDSMADQAGNAFFLLQNAVDNFQKLNPGKAIRLTLGVPDPELLPHLKRTAQKLGVAVNDTQGQPISQTSPCLLLRAVADYLDRRDFESFAALVRHPQVYAAITKENKNTVREYINNNNIDNNNNSNIIETQPLEVLTALDQFQSERLPLMVRQGICSGKVVFSTAFASEKIVNQTVVNCWNWVDQWLTDWKESKNVISDAAALVEKLFEALPEDRTHVNRLVVRELINQARRLESIPGSLIDQICPVALIELILAGNESVNVTLDDGQALRVQSIGDSEVDFEEESDNEPDSLDSVESVEVIDSRESARLGEAREGDELGTELCPENQSEQVIDLVGWLNLVWDSADVLVITSFNEGIVPQARNAHLFLPNRLRNCLGIPNNDRRLARDAYLLRVLDQTRMVKIVFGRRGSDDVPLLPSRLLFNHTNPDLAEQVKSYFDDSTPLPKVSFADSAENNSTGGNSAGSDSAEGDSAVGESSLPDSYSERFIHWAENNLTGQHPDLLTELSPTKFAGYLTCPFRFYLEHVLKLAKLNDASRELEASLFGNAIHSILQQWGENAIREQTQTWNADDIRHELDGLLDDYFARRFASSPLPSVDIQREIIRKRLSAFADFQSQREGWRILEVEQTYQTELALPDGAGSMHLKGKIDRIDFHPDLGYALLDYKSGDMGDTPGKTHYSQSRGWISFQLPLYWLLIHNSSEFDSTLPVQMGYILLPSDTSKVRFAAADWDGTQIQEAIAEAGQIALNVKRGVFWPPTGKPVAFDDYGSMVMWLKDNDSFLNNSSSNSNISTQGNIQG